MLLHIRDNHRQSVVMRRAALFVLVLTYFFSVLLGIFPYVYSYEKKTIRATRYLTIYSIAVNLLTLSIAAIPMFQLTTLLVRGPDRPLNEQIHMILYLGKMVALVVTILMNWLHRQDFVDAISELQHIRTLYFNHLKIDPKLQRKHDNSIVIKFLLALIMDVSLYFSALDAIQELTSQKLWGLTVITLMTALVNVFMNHYCFAIVSINLHYNILNAELGRILAEARRTKGQRPGFVANHCCRLADELDELAMAYERLHKWANRIVSLYKIAGACTDINYYMQNMGHTYFVYSYHRHPTEYIYDLSAWGKICVVVHMLSFWGDSYLFTFAMLEMLDMFDVCARILRQGLPLHPLDERLEQSVANFCLQIAYNPMELSIMGLYKFDKPMLFSIMSSMVMHSIILIQYDYKYN